jgi:hypothetical protein
MRPPQRFRARGGRRFSIGDTRLPRGKLRSHGKLFTRALNEMPRSRARRLAVTLCNPWRLLPSSPFAACHFVAAMNFAKCE